MTKNAILPDPTDSFMKDSESLENDLMKLVTIMNNEGASSIIFLNYTTLPSLLHRIQLMVLYLVIQAGISGLSREIQGR